MVFAYYERLKAHDKRTYRKSDETPKLKLNKPLSYSAVVDDIASTLATEKRLPIQRTLQALNDRLVQGFEVGPVSVRVLSKRPSKSWGELQGLYEPEEEDTAPRITVWMRTAQRKKVVAFRSFLRTYLHELVHHLDYELLKLEDSFHTEGFYKREASLFRQLVPDPQAVEKRTGGVAKKTMTRKPRAKKPSAKKTSNATARATPSKTAGLSKSVAPVQASFDFL